MEIPILRCVKSSQLQHGLKYENYQRYTSYCSRRLHRLRRSLNVYQGIASTAKARHQRARKLMDVSNAMILEAGENNLEYGQRMLMIQLYLAERAWSYSMLLKQETQEHPRKRYHMVRRLKKAADYADKFEKLCHDQDSPCTSRTKEEASAYSNYIKGLYKIERKKWAEARELLFGALGIYMKFSVSINDEEVLQHYRQRMDEIRANLKYCAFNLSEQDAKKTRIKVHLPATLQFHDIAYRYALETLQQESQSKTETPEEPKEESDDDDFQETREGDHEDSDQDEEDDDDDKQATSRIGGVTGLVKNWLGGAWAN